MQILLEDHYFYTLYQDTNRLLLSVVCGTVAVFDVTIQLTEAETKDFYEKGQSFIVSLAYQVLDNPDSFLSRKV